MSEVNQLITSYDAAEMLGVPYSTFNRWVRQGRIQPDFRSSGIALFGPDAVARLRNTLKRSGRGPILAGALAT